MTGGCPHDVPGCPGPVDADDPALRDHTHAPVTRRCSACADGGDDQ